MLCEGAYTGNSENLGSKTIFGCGERVIVFDVEGVLVLPGGSPVFYRSGNGGYKINPGAERAIKRAQEYGRVVFWSFIPSALGLAGYFPSDAHRAIREHEPFSKIDQYIGGVEVCDGRCIKSLSYLTASQSNIVAIEDDSFFYPDNRVVKYLNGQRLKVALQKAIDFLGRAN